jgi:hypothetical protein
MTIEQCIDRFEKAIGLAGVNVDLTKEDEKYLKIIQEALWEKLEREKSK